MTEQVRVGTTGVTVTKMGLGGAPLARARTKESEKSAMEVVSAAWNAGVRYFDTAPRYGNGLSEQRLGDALAGMPRDEFTISTKVGFLLDPARPRRNGNCDVSCDFSRDAVLRSLEESCARLQIDRIDIALIHDPDYMHKDTGDNADRGTGNNFREVMEGAYPALDELRAAGSIGAIGLGMNQWPMLLDFAQQGDFDCFMLAGRYTLLDQSALPKLIPECGKRGISLIQASVFNSGILATGPAAGATFNYAPASPKVMERARSLEAVCSRHKVALPAAALQFSLAHPVTVAVAVGVAEVSEFHADLAYATADIPEAFWREIRQRKLVDPAASTP